MVRRIAKSTVRGRRAVVVVLLALCVCAGLPTAVQARRVASAPRIFPVCIQMGGQAGPDIAGRVVVWTDNRNGQLDIYGRDLANAKDFPVCTADGSQDNLSVATVTVGGRTQYEAVWVDKRDHAEGDIYGRNLTTRTGFSVATTVAYRWFPEICDNWVVWIQARDPAGPYTIKARDLEAGKTYSVATSAVLSSLGLTARTGAGGARHTAVYTSSGGDISGRDLPNGVPFDVSTSRRFEWSPDISGDRVVWWQAGGRVMVRNLKSGTVTLVGHGARPRVDGARVAWDGGGHGGEFVVDYTAGAAVYVLDLAHSKTPVRLAQPLLTCLFPAVSGDTVVWESGPARRVLGHIHIYGARLR
jgi:beta propeller repeat protein